MVEKPANTEFDNNQFQLVYPDGIDRNFWNIARNKIILHNIKKVKNQGKIMDIGSGRGIVVSHLSEKGIDIFGVELGKTTPINNKKVNILYETNAFELNQEIRDQVKIITLFDVLEHIDKPLDFLAEVKNKFPNLKTIVLTVPAFNELWSNFDDYYGHIKRYDIKMLEDELSQVNMKIAFAKYFFNALYFIIRINNYFRKGKREIKFAAPGNVFSKLFNLILGYCFFLEYFTLPKFVRGSSILAIVKIRD